MERIAILGASRGLGLALSLKLATEGHELFLSSRKIMDHALAKDHQVKAADFTNEAVHQELLVSIKNFNPHRVFYIAGGGPYGSFASKQWKDHIWAYNLNLIFPAKLTHFLLETQSTICLKQIVLVGSAIAEDSADPMAASYSSAKHGLKGLVKTLSKEQDFDLRLFSPGYIDTDMLPPNALPRQSGKAIAKKEDVAKTLWQWSNSSLSYLGL